jgi:hypothetical protein
MPPKSPDEIVQSGLKYYGEARLNAMEEDKLLQISNMLDEKVHDASTSETTKDVANVSKADTIRYILEKKQELAKSGKKSSPLSKDNAAKRIQHHAKQLKDSKLVEVSDASASEDYAVVVGPSEGTNAKNNNVDALPDGERTKLIPSGEDGVALEVTVAKEGESTRLFKERHELRVCSFNSLKLRTGKAGLEEQWLMLIATLATFDIVLVQEVPSEGQLKKIETTRAYLLKTAFEHHSGDEWSILISDPSGPGNPEVHVALVRKPVEVVSYCTNRTACGVPLDHAPLTLKVKDKRFKNEGDQTWVLTSVHFPPKSRARERDIQIRAFLKDYEREAAFRLDTPLTEKGAKDARTPTVHHLVCGDFNCYPGIGFEIEKHGFSAPLLGEHVSTSSGGNAYDNFLLSKLGANKFSLDADVLELAIPAVTCKGQDGISDHSPIVLKIRDTASTKDKKATKTTKPATIPEGGGMLV